RRTRDQSAVDRPLAPARRQRWPGRLLGGPSDPPAGNGFRDDRRASPGAQPPRHRPRSAGALPHVPGRRRRMTRRLLWVDVKLPTPDRDAASLLVVQILDALSGLGYAVDFAALFAGPAPADPDLLARHGARLVADADENAGGAYVA